ncbi:MAG: hypothetical protein NVS4B6_31340 [Mycobacterium sp.]
MTNPAINADHSAPVRVNFTADSGGAGFDEGEEGEDAASGSPAADGPGTPLAGRSGDTDGSVVIILSCPFGSE